MPEARPQVIWSSGMQGTPCHLYNIRAVRLGLKILVSIAADKLGSREDFNPYLMYTRRKQTKAASVTNGLRSRLPFAAHDTSFILVRS